MAVKFVQAQNFSLAGAGVITGATSVVLKSFKGIDGVNLTMTDFGSLGYGTLEPGNNTQEEQISFTGVTQNSNGTATLTGVSSVLFVSPYTATAGTLKTHPGSATFIISNTSGFYNSFGESEVSGPATSTDNAIARFDGTGGNVIQNSPLTIADITLGAFGVTTPALAGVGTSFSIEAGISTGALGGTLSLVGGSSTGGNGNGGNIVIGPGAPNGSGVSGTIVLAKDISMNVFAVLDLSLISASNKTFTYPNLTGTFLVASAVNAVSPTAPNRTLTINVGGTLYYIAAKTTND